MRACLQSLESVSTLTVVDADAERVRRVCASLPGAVGFTSLDDALDDIDAAVVVTPPTTHTSMAMRLIEAGKHVLVEKPMAAESADARRMIAAAEARDVALMVGHTFVENLPAYADTRLRKQLRDLLAAGYRVSVITQAGEENQPYRELDDISLLEYPPPPEPRGPIGHVREYLTSFVWTALLLGRLRRRGPIDVLQVPDHGSVTVQRRGWGGPPVGVQRLSGFTGSRIRSRVSY